MKMRMAGAIGNLLKKNFAKAFPAGSNELRNSLLMSAVPSGLVGLTAPGDLGDKLIAAGVDYAAGAGVTAGLRGATGLTGIPAAMVEMGGGMAAYQAAYPISEQLLRIKNGGMSPTDRLMEQNRAQLEQEILQGLAQQGRIV